MRRVVVTGMGAITPVGNTVKEMWRSLRNKKCGIEEIKLFDTSGCDIKLAAEVKGFRAEEYFKSIEMRKMDRFSQFAVAASVQAFQDSGLNDDVIDHERFSVFFGSGVGGGAFFDEYDKLVNQGYQMISRMTIPNNLVNMAAANIAIRLHASGSCVSVVTACATGTDCIGRAFRDIRDGYSDIVLAGAAEACIVPVYIAGFAAIGALSDSTDPLRASIPFDHERKGFVRGEGAGSLILEEYSHARKRGAKIYGEVAGYGATCDAFSLTAPDFTLKQGARAMRQAMAEAGTEAADISYINAHGTGTKYNDEYETKIIKEVFGPHSDGICVSSTKSFMGHLLAAAGAVEAIVTVKALIDNYIPPTIGYRIADEQCDLDYVANEGKNQVINYAMSNSLGFGGHNAVLIFKSLGSDI